MNAPTNKLSIKDPVEPEIIEKFRLLENARSECANNMLNLEQERVRILRVANSIDSERKKLFEAILIDRGISPAHPASIDGKTGLVKLEGVTDQEG